MIDKFMVAFKLTPVGVVMGLLLLVGVVGFCWLHSELTNEIRKTRERNEDEKEKF